MTATAQVDKAEVVATLRSREQHGRADWVDRELPALIDTVENAALLRTLGIDVAAMSPPDTGHRGIAPDTDADREAAGSR